MNQEPKFYSSPALDDRKWYKVVLWWELRRFFYNIITLVFGIITIWMVELMGFGESIHPASPFIYGIMANLFYTMGWMVELLVRKLTILKSKTFAIWLFIIGLTFTMLLTLSPILFFALILVF